jgi:hypothetical protein
MYVYFFTVQGILGFIVEGGRVGVIYFWKLKFLGQNENNMF